MADFSGRALPVDGFTRSGVTQNQPPSWQWVWSAEKNDWQLGFVSGTGNLARIQGANPGTAGPKPAPLPPGTPTGTKQEPREFLQPRQPISKSEETLQPIPQLPNVTQPQAPQAGNIPIQGPAPHEQAVQRALMGGRGITRELPQERAVRKATLGVLTPFGKKF